MSFHSPSTTAVRMYWRSSAFLQVGQTREAGVGVLSLSGFSGWGAVIVPDLPQVGQAHLILPPSMMKVATPLHFSSGQVSIQRVIRPS